MKEFAFTRVRKKNCCDNYHKRFFYTFYIIVCIFQNHVLIAGLRTYRGKLWYLPVSGCKPQSPRSYVGGLTRSASHCAETGSKPPDIFPATSYTPVHPSRSYHDCINSRYRPLQVCGAAYFHYCVL